MKKSIGDNMIPKGWDLERGLELIHRAGYDGVEYWMGAKPWFPADASDSAVLDLLHKARNSGLVVSHVSNSLDWDFPLSSPDPKIRETAMRHLQRQIETAVLLNTDAILVVAGLVTEQSPYPDVYKRCVEALQRLGDVAARVHVRVGCENCNAEQRFLLSPMEFGRFLDDVNHAAVGIHLDLGNIHDTGFAEQWVEMLGPRITRIHVKDVLKHRGRCGNQSVYTNIFMGDNNWPAIRTAMTRVGYDGWLIAELDEYRFAPDQQFFDTSAALDRVIASKW